MAKITAVVPTTKYVFQPAGRKKVEKKVAFLTFRDIQMYIVNTNPAYISLATLRCKEGEQV